MPNPRVYICKIHGEPYEVCQKCGCNFCTRTWPLCPRCHPHQEPMTMPLPTTVLGDAEGLPDYPADLCRVNVANKIHVLRSGYGMYDLESYCGINVNSTPGLRCVGYLTPGQPHLVCPKCRQAYELHPHCWREDDPYSPYVEWEDLMGTAADRLECCRPDAEGGNSDDCTCSPCRLAYWWDGLDGPERGLLFAGMCEAGFRWGLEPSIHMPPTREREDA
uniref:Uncharacterized protein n=1 Tax=viral metagenome TaxID=1070528 RepID=A0A6M3IJ82_9ZZZZ